GRVWRPCLEGCWMGPRFSSPYPRITVQWGATAGRGSAIITTARWRSPRRPPGTRPTSWPSPPTSATRPVTRWGGNPPARAAPPCDDPDEAVAEWELARAGWAATGFPGCEPMPPVAMDEPRRVDEGLVIVEPDEVVTKAQAATGRKEVWTDTAVVMVAGLRY